MAEDQVVITILGKDKNATRLFEKVGKAAEKTGKQVEKGLGKKLQDVGKGATKAGKLLSIGVTAPLGLFAGVAVNAAMKSERLTNTLKGLAGGSQEAETYIKAIGEASLGTVSRMDALAAANRALAFEVVSNADEMANLTEIAITLGRAQGLTATQAVNDFTTALSRNSPMILDNLGITLKLTEAYEIYADKIGKTVGQLSAEEKALAFREAALIKGGEAVERMGGLQDDAAASGERMKAQMSDLSVTVGTMLLPVMSKSLDVIGPLIQKFADAPPDIQQVVVVIGALVAAMGPALGILGKFTGAFGTMIDLAPKVISGLGNIATAAIENAGAIGIATIALLGLVLAYQELQDIRGEVDKKDREARDLINKRADAMLNAKKTQRDFNKELKLYAGLAKNVKGVITGNLGALQATEPLIGLLSKTQGELNLMQQNAATAIALNTDSLEEYNAAAAIWNEVLGEGAGQLPMLTQEVYDAEASLDAFGQRAVDIAHDWENEFAPAAQDTADAVKDVGMSLEETTGPMGRVNQANIEATEIWGGASGELERFREKQDLAKEALERWRDAVPAHIEAVERTRQKNIEAKDSYIELVGAMHDATKTQVAQELISQLDPQAMGSAYVPTILGIGKAFGIFDDEAIALADNLPKLAGAFNRNLIPPENWKAAIDGLIQDAKDGDVEIGKLLGSMVEFSGDTDPAMKSAKDMALAAEDMVENFKLIPDSVTPANEKIMRHKEEMAELAQDQLPKAIGAVGDFTDEMDDMLDRYEQMPEKVKPANDKIIEHKEEMMELSQETIPKAITSWDRMVRDWEEFPARMRPTEEMLGGLGNVIKNEIEGDHYSRIYIDTFYNTRGGGGGGDGSSDYQHGGVVPGPIGVPRQVTVHGGEIILNPYQVGALGGPGGPPPPSNVSTSYGGDTFNVEINDRLSGAMFMNELDSRGRYERLNARM